MTIHISLRELIFIVAFFALGIAALRSGGLLASFTVLVGIVLVMVLAIVAFVGTAAPRAFAIGFLIPLLIYAATVVSSPNNELDPYEGILPTTKILRFAHDALVTKTWINNASGKVVLNYEPSNDPYNGFAGLSVTLDEKPDRPTFMLIAHLLLAMMLGWLGGKFATYIDQTPKAFEIRGESSDESKSR